MKYLVVIIFFSVSLFANLTKDDLKEIRSIVKDEVKAEVGALEKKMDAKFEAVDKRFESIDKRFESIDKRFESIDKRFEMLQHNMDKRFEAIDKRFEMLQHNMDRRFEQIDKRFDDQMDFLYLMSSIFTAFTAGVIGFALWDRRTIIQKAKEESLKEIKRELAKSEQKFEKIVEIVEEFAKSDERFRKIVEKHHLKLTI